MQPSAVTLKAERAGQWSVIALGASIPISTALDNVLLLFVVVCFLSSARFYLVLSSLKTNPVFAATMFLFGLLAVGTSYGNAGPDEARGVLMKYIDLMLVPIFATFFCNPAIRRYALYALAIALAATVILTFALAVGILPRSEFFIYDTLYPVPFKHSLTHSIFVSFGAFLFIQFAAGSGSRKARWFWIALAGLAVANIFFLVAGRTGFVLLGALMLYCGCLWWGWRGIIWALLLLALFSIIAYSTAGLFQDRINQGIYEYFSWSPGKSADAAGSIGNRLEYYGNTLAIVRDHPLMGVGTGGFAEAYATQVKGTRMPPTNNPHNEYLLITVQIGVAGLALLLYLFWQQWRLAPLLTVPLERHLARGLVIMIAFGCLFNSLLLDHAEGLFFAWLTGLLFAELKTGTGAMPVRHA